jgi:hypothetical protein
MPSLTDIANSPEHHWNTFLFKGKPKTGKSIAAGSFPRPMFIFDFDNRIRSLIEYFRAHNIPLDDIDFETYIGATNQYEKYDRKLEELRTSQKYKTIVWDSLTNFAELALGYFVWLRGEGEGTSGSTRKEKDFKRKGVVDLLEIEDYGGEDRATMNSIRYLMNIPNCHKVLIAHVIEINYKDLLGNTVSSQSLMTGGRKIAEKVPTLVNEVYHFYQQGAARPQDSNTHFASTKTKGLDWAGTTYPLPAEIYFTDKQFFNVMEEMLKPKGIVLGR